MSGSTKKSEADYHHHHTADPKVVAKWLKTHGAIILRIFDPEDDRVLKFFNKFVEALKTSPELTKKAQLLLLDQIVLGAFGAINFPSSFHADCVRKMRQIIDGIVSVMFAHYHGKEKGWYIQQLFDRLRFQPKGTKITDNESWHVDDCTKAKEGDTTFGGFITSALMNERFKSSPWKLDPTIPKNQLVLDLKR